MFETIQEILRQATDRLYQQATAVLPSVLAAAVIFLGAWIVAEILHALIRRVFKAAALGRFLADTGLRGMLGRYGERPPGTLIASFVYWLVLFAGALSAVDVFGSTLTAEIVSTAVFLFPKAVVAGFLLMAGFWLARFLGRHTLVWAHNEGLPAPRRLATAVRIAVSFTVVVIAADTLNFARGVFLAAFVIFAGGAALAVALAVGLGGRDAARSLFEPGNAVDESERDSVWHHL